MGGQCMPVGHEEQAGQFGLQLDPVLQGAVIVAQVQRAGGAHAGDDAIRIHGSRLGGKEGNHADHHVGRFSQWNSKVIG
jgi:hypothetical protein